MTKLLSLFIFIMIAGIAQADDNQIINDGSIVKADLDGVLFTLSPVMNFTRLSIYDSNEGTNSNYLRIDLNNSQLWLNSNADKTLSTVNYSTASDQWNFTAVGTSGYLLIKGQMQQSSANYELFDNDTLYDTQASNGAGLVAFNYAGGWSVHNFSISPQGPGPTPTPSPTTAPPEPPPISH